MTDSKNLSENQGDNTNKGLKNLAKLNQMNRSGVNTQQQETVCTCGQRLVVNIPHWLTFHPPSDDKHLAALFNCPKCLSSYIFATDHPPVKTMFNNLPTVASFYEAMEALDRSGWLTKHAQYNPEIIQKGFNPQGENDG